ncbi:MAG: ABC transporter substrate-binding protein [Desulfatiglans sp.]|jgi:branched-chain amino acid transport system substrate-binding protein|nr:ABC transporter substrate-binding protein [Thermodesulfobacteriota bacterium]MEE4353157.1 ABC transporter substrate-binding protein [Desulfatiglans sp.]
MKKSVWGIMAIGFFIVMTSNVLAAEKPSIKMIGSAVLSGKLGAIKETGWGLVDGVTMVNDRGGINGRKFEVVLEDGQYDIPLSVSIFNRVVAAEPRNELLFHSGWQTGVLHSIGEKVKENHVVCTDGSMSPAIFGENVKERYPYYFSVGVGYGDQTGILCKYIKTELHTKKEKPKLAFVYIDSGVGREPLKKLRIFEKKFDIDLVLAEPVTFTTTDYTPTLMKIRQSKADYVMLWSWSVPVSTRFIKMANKVIPETKIVSLSYVAWEIFFATAQEAFDGVYVVSPYPRPSETQNPLVAMALDAAQKREDKVKIWDLYFQGILMSLINGEAAIRADKAGNLSREGARDALESLTDWNAFGMYEGKTLDYSAHKFPRARVLRADFKTKTLIPVTEWFDVSDYLK